MTLNLPSVDHKQKATNMQMFGQRIRKTSVFMPIVLVSEKEGGESLIFIFLLLYDILIISV